MQKSVVIVAGGAGRRMASLIPKQFLEMAGKPVLMRTIQRFIDFDNKMEIILVLPSDQVRYWDKLCFIYDFSYPIKIALGGDTRFASVCNGFKYVTRDCVTAIHDGVRPLVSISTIRECYEQAGLYGSAIPCISLSESLREVSGQTSTAVKRDNLVLVQTPQVFRYDILETSLKQEYIEAFSDDATVVEHAGFPVHIVEGNPENIKITTPADLRIAEYLFNNG